MVTNPNAIRRSSGARAERAAPASWEDQVIGQRGRLIVGGQPVAYYTLNPAPTQWVAVGILKPTGLLVGSGATELEAIQALNDRLRPPPVAVMPSPDMVFITEWSAGYGEFWCST